MQAGVSPAPLVNSPPFQARPGPRGAAHSFEDLLRDRLGEQCGAGPRPPGVQGQVRKGTSARPDQGLYGAPQLGAPAPDAAPAAGAPAPAGKGGEHNFPPLLRELARFLAALPGQTLKIPSQQVESLKAYLVQAGFPAGEVENLLFNPETQDYELSLGKLTALWQQIEGSAASAGGRGLTEDAPAHGASPAADPRQDPGYRRLWQVPTLSEDQMPILRLALARLGATPDQLSAVEGEAAGGGVSLAQVWEILAGSSKNPLPSSELIAQQGVSGEELKTWRHLLQKAGLTPEEVDRLLGEPLPATQKELKASLLSLAPEPAVTETQDPEGGKPVYLPENLQVGAFRLGQDKENKASLFGEGRQAFAGVKGQGGETPVVSTASAAQEFFGATAAHLADPAAAQATAGRAGGPPNAATWQPLNPALREAVWSQVQSGILSHLGPGESRVSLQLNPPELGRIHLTLQLNGQELAVTAMASRPEVAEMAAQGASQLLQSLAQQGVVLTQFQVQVHPAPGLKAPAAYAGNREKGGGTGDRHPADGRRRLSEVDRFV